MPVGVVFEACGHALIVCREPAVTGMEVVLVYGPVCSLGCRFRTFLQGAPKVRNVTVDVVDGLPFRRAVRAGE